MNASQITGALLACTMSACLLFSCSTSLDSAENTPDEIQKVEMNEYHFDVLIFSKTEGFRHNSIPPAINAIKELGSRKAFSVATTEDASLFTLDNLADYEAIIFLNTTLDVLNPSQQEAFKAYIQQGGGFVGVHGAADTEYDWEWYSGLIGAYFESHPAVQQAEVQFIDRQQAFAEGLPSRWLHTDEWYNYNINPRSAVHILAAVKESTYEGGTMGHDHPIAWAHEYDGGRSFYTGLGHTSESYSNPTFLTHLYNGIRWAAGQIDADVKGTLASNYEKVVLTGQLTNPMELDVTNDGRVFVVEWGGAVKMWEPTTQKMRVVGWMPVDKSIEDGLLGIALDPNFDENGWIYIYYSPIQGEDTSNRLARFTFDGDWIQLESEVIILEVPNQRIRCCHSAGSLQFDSHGNLFLSTGDNSGGDRDHESQKYRKIADQGRSAANTNDLRGKILRITPQQDGTYTIPEGNLFEADSLHKGEIYTMGHRNPFRYSIDNKTGWIYWGDVGPGSSGGFDEFNRAKEPGFFGWPLFTGYNTPFNGYYFHGVDSMAQYVNPQQPINASPYNTGSQELPTAQPALIAYFYGMSEEYPELGAGGMNPMAGPIFHYDAETAHELAMPSYYNEKFLIYEWMRHWLQVISFDEDGELMKIDLFLPGMNFVRPTDIEVGPDGRLYVLEWGDEFWGSNENAQLVRLDYYGGKKPLSVASALTEMKSATLGMNEAPIDINWPPDGGVFEINTPVPYHISLHDQALSDQVEIQTFTGFDTAPIPLDDFTALEGMFMIDSSYTHTPNVNYVNRFAELEACLNTQGTHEWCRRIRLNPRLKQAEHTIAAYNARRTSYSTHPASEHWGKTDLTVLKGAEGMRLEYTPFNPVNIESITFRFRVEKDCDLEVRLEAEESASLAHFSLGPGVGESVIPAQHLSVKHLPADEKGISEVIERGYHNWREITVPINETAVTGNLILEVVSGPENGDLELDWMQFNGSGVAERK